MNSASNGMRRFLWAAAKVVLVGVVVASVIWWVRFSPVEVDVHRTTTGTVVAEIMGTGTLEARVRAAVGPRITGRLASVRADQGDRITAGQLVATLDDGDLRQRVEIARAELAVTRAGVDRAAGAVVRAEAVAVQARASFLRTEQLAARDFASADELDTATRQRDIAQAELELAGLAKAESESLVLRAEQSLRYDEERLVDTRITAPFDALVVQRHREPGDVVVPGGTILDVVATAELWVSAWVDETALSRLAVGQPARIVFRSAPDAALAGRVVRLAPQTDAETREFLIDVAVDELPTTWAIHQRAEVYIESGRREGVVVLPQRLVVWRGGVPGVLLDSEGTAQWSIVRLGLRGGDTVEVLEGLVEGQLVIEVASGAEAPREGRSVRYVQP